MELHGIISVSESGEQGVYIVQAEITGSDGIRETVDYVSRAGDPYGLAPQVRAAVDQWIADGNPVTPAE